MAMLTTASLVSIFYLNILMLCMQGNPAFADLPLHRQRNSTLLKQILNAESDSKVPEYEVVQVQILPKTSADDQSVIRVQLSAFGKDIRLRLERNDDFSNRSKNVKYFEANLADTGVQLSEVIIEDNDPGTPYIDPVQMAAVTLRQGPCGKLQMDGVIGDELLIKPAPNDSFLHYERYWDFSESEDKLNSTKNDTGGFFDYSSSTTTENEHIVYRSSTKSKSAFKIIFDDEVYSNSTNDKHQNKRNLHAFPELLLMVDYDTYAMHVSHGFDDAQIRRYYVSFLNGVDLKFKILSDPKISLVLSHIIIFKSREANPYEKKSLYNNNTALEAYTAFYDLAKGLYSLKIKQQMGETDFPEFDAAILLTKLDMCTKDSWLCDFGTAGIGHIRGACLIKHLYRKWEGIAIVEDKGGFDGILSTAHEIAHLLGAFHDDIYDSQTPYCIDNDGYIMSSMLASVRKLQWSECSIKQIRHFLSSENAACLFNQPNYQNELEGSELPGAMLSLDEQCNRFWGTRASAWDNRVCASLHCYEPEDPAIRREVLWKTLPPAAEGSSCGENLHCRHGKCVSKYLTYSRAWNMAVDNDSSEYINFPTVTTTTSTTTVSTTTVSTTEIIATTTEHPEGCPTVSEIFAFSCRTHFLFYAYEKACNILRGYRKCCSTYKLFCEV